MKFLTNQLHSHSRAAVIFFQFSPFFFQTEQGAESQKENLMKFLTNQLHSHSRTAIIHFLFSFSHLFFQGEQGAESQKEHLMKFLTHQLYSHTGWRRPVGCLKLHVISCKRATNYRALLRKMTCRDRASCGSSPPCSRAAVNF